LSPTHYWADKRRQQGSNTVIL